MRLSSYGKPLVRLAPRKRVGAPPPAPHDSIAFAWHVHTAQEAWTGRVDGKAATFLVLEAAILSAMTGGQLTGHLLAGLPAWRGSVVIAGFVISAVSVLVAVSATIPLLGRAKNLRATHDQNFIYFGHLRYWSATQLEARLHGLTRDDELHQLALQLIALSKRNWAKHRNLRWAMLLGSLGAALVAGALLIAR
jgi:hypothetical protein